MNFPITPSTAWLLLLIAGLLEIIWAVSMKASEGFTRWHLTRILDAVFRTVRAQTLRVRTRRLSRVDSQRVAIELGT